MGNITGLPINFSLSGSEVTSMIFKHNRHGENTSRKNGTTVTVSYKTRSIHEVCDEDFLNFYCPFYIRLGRFLRTVLQSSQNDIISQFILCHYPGSGFRYSYELYKWE